MPLGEICRFFLYEIRYTTQHLVITQDSQTAEFWLAETRSFLH